MQKGNYLSGILRSNKTVFSTQDISLLWEEPRSTATWVRLSYFVQTGDLFRIRKGWYAKSKKYNKLELASRLLTPSYVSFETALVKEGLIFQFYHPIFIASYVKKDITIDNQIYAFRKIKDSILKNFVGIEFVDETFIATKERAFLDTLYVYEDYYFDNLRSMDWDKVFEILPIYNNNRMVKITNLLLKKQRNLDNDN